jgi:hypothetical protein
MWKLITDLVSGTAAYFRFAEKKQDLKNSPAMTANAEAARDQKIKDDANAVVAKGDLDEIRKRASE